MIGQKLGNAFALGGKIASDIGSLGEKGSAFLGAVSPFFPALAPVAGGLGMASMALHKGGDFVNQLGKSIQLS